MVSNHPSIVFQRLLTIKNESLLNLSKDKIFNKMGITCMKSYLITALYNSLKTITHYYDAWVNHDEAQYYQDGGDS